MNKYPEKYLNRINSNTDFLRTEIKDIIIYKYNYTRATIKEAQEFRTLLLDELENKKLRILVDLSECDYIDSTFLGVLVFISKRIAERKGELKFTKPQHNALELIKLTGLYNLLDLYDNLEKAIASFELN